MGYNDQAPEFLQTQYDAIVLETDIALRPSLTVTVSGYMKPRGHIPKIA